MTDIDGFSKGVLDSNDGEKSGIGRIFQDFSQLAVLIS